MESEYEMSSWEIMTIMGIVVALIVAAIVIGLMIMGFLGHSIINVMNWGWRLI